MSEEDIESPYCEVCGTCGYIGCCGIRNFIEYHIEGKTNCKNEDIIINELINLCDYRDEVFEENKRLNKALLDIKKLVLNNACLDEEINKCVDDLIYYKCDELLDIVNKVLGSDKE